MNWQNELLTELSNYLIYR